VKKEKSPFSIIILFRARTHNTISSNWQRRGPIAKFHPDAKFPVLSDLAILTLWMPLGPVWNTRNEKYRNRKTSGIEMAYSNNPMGI
jgi:hypothetical protein